MTPSNAQSAELPQEAKPLLVRVVCVARYENIEFKRKLAGWRPAGTPDAKPLLPSGYMRPGEDARQAASRIWAELSTMSEWGGRPNIWLVWTTRFAQSGELLIFVRRKGSFLNSLAGTLWKNGTPVVPVSLDTELAVPEMADGIKAFFRDSEVSNPYFFENPDVDADEEFAEQESRDAQRQAEKAAAKSSAGGNP